MAKFAEILLKYKTQFRKIPRTFKKDDLDDLASWGLEKLKSNTYVLSGDLRNANYKKRISEKEIKLANDSDYANVIEFGKKKKSGGRTKRHPFIRPTVKDIKRRRKLTFKKSLIAALKRAQNG